MFKGLKAAYDKFILWLYTKGFVTMVIIGAGFKGERMSHNNGIVGRGKIKIVDNPEFPDHEFFTPGREFIGRLRHAGASYTDDAMLVIRSATLKFSDEEYESPLDIEMNTGKIALFWSAKNFLYFAKMRKENKGTEYEEYYKEVPKGLVGSRASVRRPETYTQMYYYTKTVFHFKAKDGKTRYVKYRLEPWDRGVEDGIPPEEELADLWNAQILEGETRSRTFLKDDFEKRVKKAPVKYHLQLQLWEWKEGDDEEVFNSHNYWDEENHPWMDLATVEIDETLSYEVGNYFRSNIGHQPKSLGLIEAKSISDYNSINYMRANSGAAKAFRVWYYKRFGMPKDYPEYGERNV